ncbi:flagellar hook-associated protein FlgK [Planctomycetota bacterium]
MDSFYIGISGLEVAQDAFAVIGNNIANAATEGYHRQRLNLVPEYSSQIGELLLGGGVDVAGVTRMIDTLLEEEIYRQQSSLSHISQEVHTLSTVETTFGEILSGGGLNEAIDNFFNALKDLSANPTDSVYQNQALTAAEVMTDKFRSLDQFLMELESRIILQADEIVEKINSLVSTVAQLNENIEKLEISGTQANNLRDNRDQCINELSQLVSIQVESRDNGLVNLSIAGIPVVTDTTAFELEVGLDQNSELGITIAGEFNYYTDVQGGQLGGLLSLKNSIISDIGSDLNTLAGEMICQINQYHVQGTGSYGSFTQLNGWSMASGNLADIEPPINNGNIYIRIIDTNTGNITREVIPVDVSADSLTTIASSISAITGLNASVIDSQLSIQADSGYEFDFLPGVLPLPTNSDFSGASSPPDVEISGIYTGVQNQTFTYTVSGTGSIGNGSLELTVTNDSGQTVSILNVGSGYAAGDFLRLENGIKISVGIGDIVDGNSFDVQAFTDTDTSEILAAIDINTFFSGSDASDITVSSDIRDKPGRIATAIGPDMTDNKNIVRMAAINEQMIADLNDLTVGEFYRRLATNIGQQLAVRQLGKDNTEAMLQNLANQQSQLSGVDINDEAAQMLVFEQMFKALSKYLSTLQTSYDTIINLL